METAEEAEEEEEGGAGGGGARSLLLLRLRPRVAVGDTEVEVGLALLAGGLRPFLDVLEEPLLRVRVGRVSAPAAAAPAAAAPAAAAPAAAAAFLVAVISTVMHRFRALYSCSLAFAHPRK